MFPKTGLVTCEYCKPLRAAYIMSLATSRSNLPLNHRPPTAKSERRPQVIQPQIPNLTAIHSFPLNYTVSIIP